MYVANSFGAPYYVQYPAQRSVTVVTGPQPGLNIVYRPIPPFTSLRSTKVAPTSETAKPREIEKVTVVQKQEAIESEQQEYVKPPLITPEMELTIRMTYTQIVTPDLASPEQCAKMPLEILIDLGILALRRKQLELLEELAKMTSPDNSSEQTLNLQGITFSDPVKF